MARYIANSAANLSSSSGWDTVTNTPTIHASTNVTVSITNRFTATFTAPSTTNKCTGVMFYTTSITGGATQFTITLQENSVDTACTVTATPDQMLLSSFYYFRFPTPYTFTTTTAGAYRFKVSCPSSSNTWAADSGGSLYFFMATDDRHTKPGVGDDAWVCGLNGNATTFTLDGTSNSWGSGTETNAGGLQRSIGNACSIGQGATLNWDTGASATLQLRGNLDVYPGGNWQMGTVASPYPSGKTAKLVFDQNGGLTASYGWHSWINAQATLQGSPSPDTTNWELNYVSGSGTAASPITLSANHSWNVGDNIIVTATGNDAANYNETEERYVISIPAANQIVVSSTKGGAENALTYTHSTNAWVLNIERNVIITSTTTSFGFHGFNRNTVANQVKFKWARFEYAGASTTNNTSALSTTTASYQLLDYLVLYRPSYNGFNLATTKTTETWTGLVAVFMNSASTTAGVVLSTCANKTLNDCFVVGNNRVGFNLSSCSAMTLNRCHAIANNTAGSSLSVATGGFICTNAYANLNSCEVTCNRNMGISLSGTAGTVFTNCEIGTRGNNSVSINTLTGTLNQAAFNSCNFSTTDTLVSGYLSLNDGTSISFQNRQNVTNRNSWYTNYGSARATGSGLTDTTVRTPGSLALQVAPEDNAHGFEWDFQIPVDAHNTASFQGYFGANTALATDVGASARIELWLPGSGTPDSTVAIPLTDITGGATWNSVSISAQYTGSVPSLATVKIFVLTATANAYLYADDFYNAGNTVTSKDPATGLDIWSNGLPLPIIAPLQITPGYLAASVWDEPASTHTLSGTMGQKENQGLTVGKFIGLK